LSHAEKWNLVARNVAKLVDLPKRRRHEPRVLAPKQAQAFVDAASEFRLGAVFSVSMALGLRLGEALGLTWDDVSFERKTLRVRQTLQRLPKAEGEQHGKVVFGEPKSDKSRRVISLPSFAVELLRRHQVRQKEDRLKAGSDWEDKNLVFTSTIGTPVDERNLRREFDAILKAAELPHMRIHDLRHTCASLLLAKGIHAKIVQEVLGHSQITLTLDTYSHLIPGLAGEAAKKIDEILVANPVGVKVGVKTGEPTPEAAAIA
jgi:integrase